MRRKPILLLLIVLLVATSATGVSASTDCERWITAYKTDLVHSQAVKRMQAAHARMRRYAKRKLANYVPKPAHPKLIRAHAVRPRYTRQQILDRFNLLCGDLPGTSQVADKLMQGEMTPARFAENRDPYIPTDMGIGDGAGFVPPAEGPTDVPTGMSHPDAPPFFASMTPLFGGGGLGGSNPGTEIGATGGPGTPGTPDVPVAPVPEPGSIVLMLTGIAGGVGAVRRRLMA